MQPDFLAMLRSAMMQALPYLAFLAAFVIALKWLEAKFVPKKRGRILGDKLGSENGKKSAVKPDRCVTRRRRERPSVKPSS
jgi:hypothetical protein